MNVPGIVTNVTAFGAFIDVGVHQDGLVHISELSDEFVKNPADMVKVQQKVKVKVINVDLKRNRISLSMKAVPGRSTKKTMTGSPKKQPKVRGANTSAPFNNPFAHLHTDEVE